MVKRPFSIRRLMRLLVIICLLIYLALGFYVFYAQRSMIYFPRRLDAQHVDEEAHEAGLLRWTNAIGQSIGLRRPSPKQPAEGAVLICYGNGGTAAGCRHYADSIQQAAAFDVFILEYPGYQDRPGEPSQASFSAAAEDAFLSLPRNGAVYLLGESLGSGIAAHLAGTHPDRVKGVILISPYNSLIDVGQAHMRIFPVSLMLRDRYSPEDDFRNYHGKLGISVDGRDQVVPERFGRRLYDGYNGPKKLWSFPLGGHIQIENPPQFWREVIAFWRS